MARKEKIGIRRSDDFQDMDEALTKAMADLDSTIDRVSAIFEAVDQDEAPETLETEASEADQADSKPATGDEVETGASASGDVESGRGAQGEEQRSEDAE